MLRIHAPERADEPRLCARPQRDQARRRAPQHLTRPADQTDAAHLLAGACLRAMQSASSLLSPRTTSSRSPTTRGCSPGRTSPSRMPRSAVGTTSTATGSGAPSPPSARPTNDGNPATIADPLWTPLFDPSTPVASPPALVTPPFPYYPSGHNCAGGSILSTLLYLLRHRPAGLQRTQPQVRHHAYLPPLLLPTLRENINARVWAGIHFRTSDTQGARWASRSPAISASTTSIFSPNRQRVD